MGNERPWWVDVPDACESVPVFADFGMPPVFVEGRMADADEWMCAREQLWAMREGLA